MVENEDQSIGAKAQRNNEEEAVVETELKLSELMMRLSWISSLRDFLKDWLFTNIIGFFVVSYWRGTWVLLDIWTCEQPSSASLLAGDSFCFAAIESEQEVRFQSAWKTYVPGCVLLAIGLGMMSRGWWYNMQEPFRKSFLRVLMVYILGFATVNIWHGIWYLLDRWFLSDVGPFANFWWSTGLGVLVCYSLCSGASLLAPPAIFLVDGPGVLPPPIAITIVSSYRSIALPAGKGNNDDDPYWLITLDIVLSYLVLPWGVVAFWRGFWYLMDEYLWGFTNSVDDVRMSILWSYLLGLAFLLLGSEDVVMHIPAELPSSPTMGRILNFVAGRLRTLVLAVGAVNFWRAVWLLWDEYLGQTTLWSAILSHALGVIFLLFLGCLSCITAPPSTLGVDAIAHPNCEDEPLFHNVPIPSEVLFTLGIGRNPMILSEDEECENDLKSVQEEEAERGLGAFDVEKERAPAPARSSLIRRQSSAYIRSSLPQQQNPGHMRRSSRMESVPMQALSQRHLMKRQSSQFFRSR